MLMLVYKNFASDSYPFGYWRWFLQCAFSYGLYIFIQREEMKKTLIIYVAKMSQLYIKPEISKKIYITGINHGKIGSDPVSTLTHTRAKKIQV